MDGPGNAQRTGVIMRIDVFLYDSKRRRVKIDDAMVKGIFGQIARPRHFQ
jgi:hypothetical protein